MVKTKARNNKNVKAPAHLREESRIWWTDANADYELDAHHLLLLTAACEALDRATEARETLKAEGSYFVNRHGEHKAHPAIAVERDNRALFARLLRELQLDDPTDDTRPPALSGYRRR